MKEESFSESTGFKIRAKKSETWTPQLVNRLCDYANDCIRLSWMHSEESDHYNTIDRTLTRISSILSVLATVMVSGILNVYEPFFFLIISYTAISLNAFLSVINTVKFVESFGTIQNNHDRSSVLFLTLYTKIKNHLVLDIDNRMNGNVFLESVDQSYIEIMRHNPTVRKSTEKKWDESDYNYKLIRPDAFKSALDLRSQYRDTFNKDNENN